MSRDREWMQRALDLASRGRGRIEPNPPVGAVIVRADSVLGEGYHANYGGPHAEVAALRSFARKNPRQGGFSGGSASGASASGPSSGPSLRGTTLYVTLEPCSTHGKTPPCSRAVIEAAPARVVVACRDPNPDHRGAGLRQIRAAGIAVEVGLLGAAGRRAIEPFATYLAGDLPFTSVKWAMTLDGQVATRTGASKWITSTASRREGHAERARSDAIVVGVGTVLADDPELTTRHVRGRDPVRVVIDSRLRTPPGSRLVRTAEQAALWIVTTRQAPARAASRLEQAGCRVLRVGSRQGRVSLVPAWRRLRKEGLHRILLEGGPTLAGDAMRRGLVHRVLAFVGARMFVGSDGLGPIGGAGAAQPAAGIDLEVLRRRSLGEGDFLVEALVGRADSSHKGATSGRGRT